MAVLYPGECVGQPTQAHDPAADGEDDTALFVILLCNISLCYAAFRVSITTNCCVQVNLSVNLGKPMIPLLKE